MPNKIKTFNEHEIHIKFKINFHIVPLYLQLRIYFYLFDKSQYNSKQNEQNIWKNNISIWIWRSWNVMWTHYLVENVMWTHFIIVKHAQRKPISHLRNGIYFKSGTDKFARTKKQNEKWIGMRMWITLNWDSRIIELEHATVMFTFGWLPWAWESIIIYITQKNSSFDSWMEWKIKPFVTLLWRQQLNTWNTMKFS